MATPVFPQFGHAGELAASAGESPRRRPPPRARRRSRVRRSVSVRRIETPHTDIPGYRSRAQKDEGLTEVDATLCRARISPVPERVMIVASGVRFRELDPEIESHAHFAR